MRVPERGWQGEPVAVSHQGGRGAPGHRKQSTWYWLPATGETLQLVNQFLNVVSQVTQFVASTWKKDNFIGLDRNKFSSRGEVVQDSSCQLLQEWSLFVISAHYNDNYTTRPL